MNVKNFFTKATVVLLACLLVCLGIGNLLSGDDEKEEVARVGKEVITSDEYKSLYQNFKSKFLDLMRVENK
jgi:peptidyl-prolyl cis-trans isomerase D